MAEIRPEETHCEERASAADAGEPGSVRSGLGRRAGEDTSRAESGEVTAAALGPVGAAADSKMHYVPSH